MERLWKKCRTVIGSRATPTVMVFSHQSKATTRQGLFVVVGPGVKGIIRMHRSCRCLLVVLLWCENTISFGPRLVLGPILLLVVAPDWS